MAVVQTLIGNVRGPQGPQGETGATGATGAAATISVGSVTTTTYGKAAKVTNSGTSSAAVFDFVIPQGAPGETVTDMSDLTLSSMTESTASYPVPVIGETGKVIFGKIKKWFADMYALATGKIDAPTGSINLYDNIFLGVVTNGGRYIYFHIPIQGINGSVSIAGNWTIYSIAKNSSILSGDTLASLGTVTTSVRPAGVGVSILLDTAISDYNMTPVAIRGQGGAALTIS